MANIRKTTDLEKALLSSGQTKDEVSSKKIYERMRNAVRKGANPEEVLRAYGLEPDYFFDLL